MLEPDVLIGKNAAKYRGERSQKDVAAEMRARGWKWSQATVWSIEKGERPLRLAEAEDLAEILHTYSNHFLDSEADVTIGLAMRRAADSQQALLSASVQYFEALLNLALTADGIDSLDEETVEQIRDFLSDTPSAVAYRAIERSASKNAARDDGAIWISPGAELRTGFVAQLVDGVTHVEHSEAP